MSGHKNLWAHVVMNCLHVFGRPTLYVYTKRFLCLENCQINHTTCTLYLSNFNMQLHIWKHMCLYKI